jgi:aspartate/methionine/tyrosine aminotransferase
MRKGCESTFFSAMMSAMIGPSVRAASVRHFLVMEVLERAQQLESSGRDIVHLEVGEPDFTTPASAIAAGREAISAGRTHYTHSLGIGPLREEIARAISIDYGTEMSVDRVVVTIGSSAALQLAFAALLDAGDEVLLADPGYPCYANIATVLGAAPVQVRTLPETSFQLNADLLRSRLGPRTRAVVLNSPANPTGAMLAAAELSAIAELPIAIVSDEIYHGLSYECGARSALEFSDEAFVVGGFSKRYAMTGWRIGWLVVPQRFVRVVQAMQQNLFISASDFGQWAALAALRDRDAAERMRHEYDVRRRYLIDALPEIGLRIAARPEGAFYVFADASAYSPDSMKLTMDLLESAGVAVAPGIDFGPGGEGHIRLSYSTSMDRLREGVRRLGAYFTQD